MSFYLKFFMVILVKPFIKVLQYLETFKLCEEGIHTQIYLQSCLTSNMYWLVGYTYLSFHTTNKYPRYASIMDDNINKNEALLTNQTVILKLRSFITLYLFYLGIKFLKSKE